MAIGKRGLWLKDSDELVFHFGNPEVRCARACFYRMLRVPDEDYVNACPEPLGTFPLELVDDHAERLPPEMVRRGGVMLPIYPFEALRVSLWGGFPVPFAVKVGAGKINVITGQPWTDGLHAAPQDYLVVTNSTELEGFYVDRGIARQFVAAELGDGITVEEQITGNGSMGGLQIAVYPFESEAASILEAEHERLMARTPPSREMRMGFMPGGRLDQKLFTDKFNSISWLQQERLRCFVHLVPYSIWQTYTGKPAPPSLITPEVYAKAGLKLDPTYLHLRVSLPATGLLTKLKSFGSFFTASNGIASTDDAGGQSTSRAVPASRLDSSTKR